MEGFATVKDMRRRGDGTYAVSVEVGNGHGCEVLEFVLLDELFEKLDLGDPTGESIDEEEIGALELFEEITEAYGSACASFAYSPCSHRALKKKLLSKRFSRDACERAIGMIRDKAFIDEEQIALRRAELMVEKLWGRARIINKLREELFEDTAIERVGEYLCEVDFAEKCALVIEKKYKEPPCERKEREKMYASLLRLGFSTSDIREALRIIARRSQ